MIMILTPMIFPIQHDDALAQDDSEALVLALHEIAFLVV